MASSYTLSTLSQYNAANAASIVNSGQWHLSQSLDGMRLIPDGQPITFTHSNPTMANNKELTADEKLIVRALKGEKTASEIAMLVLVARLTQRTPAAVMELHDDMIQLVTQRIEESPVSSLAPGGPVETKG